MLLTMSFCLCFTSTFKAFFSPPSSLWAFNIDFSSCHRFDFLSFNQENVTNVNTSQDEAPSANFLRESNPLITEFVSQQNFNSTISGWNIGNVGASQAILIRKCSSSSRRFSENAIPFQFPSSGIAYFPLETSSECLY